MQTTHICYTHDDAVRLISTTHNFPVEQITLHPDTVRIEQQRNSVVEMLSAIIRCRPDEMAAHFMRAFPSVDPLDALMTAEYTISAISQNTREALDGLLRDKITAELRSKIREEVTRELENRFYGTNGNAVMSLSFIFEAVKTRKKLEAIKHLRTLTGLGLKEAKDYIDANWDRLCLMYPPEPAPVIEGDPGDEQRRRDSYE